MPWASRRWPGAAGAASSGPGSRKPRRGERHRREQARGGRQVDFDGDVEPGRGGAHDAADHGADAPHAVQRVQDRAAVEALHAQAVGVGADVGVGVQGARHRQHGGQREPRRREADQREVGGDRHRAHPRHAARPEPPHQQPTQEPEGERAEPVGADGRAEGGVGELELGLQVREARDQVARHRAVDEEQRRDGAAGAARFSRQASPPPAPFALWRSRPPPRSGACSRASCSSRTSGCRPCSTGRRWRCWSPSCWR